VDVALRAPDLTILRTVNEQPGLVAQIDSVTVVWWWRSTSLATGLTCV